MEINFIKKNIVNVLIFTLLWAVILIASTSVFSGYHFVDDHEIIRMKDSLNEVGFYNTYSQWIQRDLTFRFRPGYYLHRVLKVYIFGNSFIVWSLYNFLLAVVSSLLLYKFLTFIKLRKAEAILATCLMLLGPQAAVWWRLGPSESLGVFLLSVCLFLIRRRLQEYDIRKGRIFDILFVISCFILSLQKESFLIAIPAILFLRIVLEFGKVNISIIKSRLVIIALVCLFLALEIFYIKMYVGVEGYHAAGIARVSMIKYLKVFLELFSTSYYYIIAVVILALNGYVLFVKKIKISKLVDNNKLPIGLFIIAISSQMLIYSKGGMHERYLLPASIFLVISVFWAMVKYRELYGNNKVVYGVWVTALMIIVLNAFIVSYSKVSKFVEDGITTNNVLQVVDKNTNNSDNILIVKDLSSGCELAVSFKNYAKHSLGKKNVYLYRFVRRDNKQIGKCANGHFSEKILEDENDFFHGGINYRVVVLFPGAKGHFSNEIEAHIRNLKKYDYVKFSKYEIFIRK